VDDGFSGLNQNRLSLKRLLADVKKKKIKFVITKNYSRLGRNHLEMEHLREDFFPHHDCRYIARNDHIDSLYEDNLAGSKAVINSSTVRTS
jgi:DNA invertase Pin-like site-specific DNA recombinase